MASFVEFIRDFMRPDGAEVNLGFLKAKYSDSTKVEIQKVLSFVRSRRVLFADIDHEIWEYAFASLKELRSEFVDLGGALNTAAGREIAPAVNFIIDVITAYLAEYETGYIRFMSGPSYPNMSSAHKERNWPDLAGC